jgi:lysophospholipase L1-like esterase
VSAPANLTAVTVTGTYIDAQGNAASGYVIFTPTTTLLDGGTGNVILPRPVQVSLVAGVITAPLFATDDVDAQPQGWAWRVDESNVTPGNQRVYYIQIPSSVAPTVSLAALGTAVPTTTAFTQPTAAGIGAAYASAEPIATAVFLGNSYTARAVDTNTTPTAFYDWGWPTWFQALSGQRLKVLNWAGVSGERIDQFAARVSTQVTPYAPGWVFIDGPTNDISQGYSLATIQANYLALLSSLAPARVVAYTIPANTPNTSPQNAVRDQFNDWLRTLPQSSAVHPVSLIVAEGHDVLTTAGAETFYSPYSADGTHPNADGAQALARSIFSAVSPYLPGAYNSRLSAGADSLNFLGSAGAFINPVGGLAASWTNTDGVNLTPSIVASTDGIIANWQRVTVTSSGTSAQLYSRPLGWNVGDGVYGSVEVRPQSLGSVSGINPMYYLRVTCLGGSNPAVYALADTGLTGRAVVPGTTLTLRTPSITIPVGTTDVQIGLVTFGQQVTDWRRARVARA